MTDPSYNPLSVATAKQVNDFHRNADTDRRPESIHHTNGNTHNQAAYGDHIHDGSNGLALIDSTAGSFSENLGSAQGRKDAIKQIISLLKSLGATDLTTVSGKYPEILIGSVTITWTAAGAASDIIPITFSPAFSAIPKFTAMIRVTTTPTNVMATRMTGSITTGGVSIQVASTVSLAAGSSCGCDWIAINMVNYT